MSRGIVDKFDRWEVGGANGATFAIENEQGRPWVRLVIEDNGKRTVVCFDLDHDQDGEGLAMLASILKGFADRSQP